MSKIRIDSEATLINGQPLTFKSPADCSEIEGLIIYYPVGDTTTSKEFKFVDAHGVDVGSGTISLFAENVLVKVVLDTDQGKAYVQNADTNAYLEGRFLTNADGFMQKMMQMLKGDSDTGIMNGENKKIFGYGVDSKFYTGDPEYPLTFRGSAENPTYNGYGLLKVQTGSYTGTGKSGSDGKNKITFNFTPKIVIVYESVAGVSTYGIRYMIAMYGTSAGCTMWGGDTTSVQNDMTISAMKFTWTTTSFTWWQNLNTSNGYSDNQLNYSGETYKWIAIG